MSADFMEYTTDVTVKRNKEGKLGIAFAPIDVGLATQRLKVIDPVIVPGLKCNDIAIMMEGQSLAGISIEDIQSRLDDRGLDTVRFTIQRLESVKDVAVNKPTLICWNKLDEIEINCEMNFSLSRQLEITRKLAKVSHESYVIIKNSEVVNIQYDPGEGGSVRQILQRGDRVIRIGDQELTVENASQKLRSPPTSFDNGKSCIKLFIKRPIPNPFQNDSTERFDSIQSFQSSLSSYQSQPNPARPGNDSPPSLAQTVTIDRHDALDEGLVGPGDPRLVQPHGQILASFQATFTQDRKVYNRNNTSLSRVRICVHSTTEKNESLLVRKIFEGPQPDRNFSTIRRTDDSEKTILRIIFGEYHTHADIPTANATTSAQQNVKFSLLDAICSDNKLCQVERKPLFQSVLMEPDQTDHMDLSTGLLKTAIQTVCSNMHLEIFDFSQVCGHMLTDWFAPILFNAYSIHIVFASDYHPERTLSLLQDIYFHSGGDATIILCCNERTVKWLSGFNQLGKRVLVLTQQNQPFRFETESDFDKIRDELYRQLTLMKRYVETRLHVLNAVFEVTLRLRHLEEYFLEPRKIERILKDLSITGCLSERISQIRDYLHKAGVVFDPQHNKMTALSDKKQLLVNPQRWMKEVIKSVMKSNGPDFPNDTAEFLKLLNISFTERVNGVAPILPIRNELKMKSPNSPFQMPGGVRKLFIAADRGQGAEPLPRMIIRDVLNTLSRECNSCSNNYAKCCGQFHVRGAQLFVNTEDDRPATVISIYFKCLDNARPFSIPKRITELLKGTALYKLYGDDMIVGPKCPLPICNYQFKPHIIKLSRLSCAGVPLKELLCEYVQPETLQTFL